MTPGDDGIRATRDLLADLVSSLPAGGEARPGQAEMAGKVAEALAGRRRVAVRAGTGTGKSLAVLAAIAATGVRTVVATATKALQDQYANKELPHLAEHHPVSWAVLKGRSNYLCLARMSEARSVLAGEPVSGSQDSLFADDEPSERDGEMPEALDDGFSAIEDWAESTTTGDLSELPFELDRRSAPWVSTGPEGCPGAALCPQGEDCFAEQAIAKAREADVVLVNTALLGADLSLDGALLGDAEAYVVDEAHDAEDILGGAFGAEVRGDDLLRVERNLRVAGSDSDEVREELRRAATRIDTEVAAVVADPSAGAALRNQPGGTLAEPAGLAEALGRAAGAVASAQEAARKALRSNGEDPRAEAARRSSDRLAEVLERITSGSEEDAVWVDEAGPRLRRVPVDLGERLQLHAWGDSAVVLTSATVSEPMMQRLGLGADAAFTDVGSPFDHRAAALLYVPPLLASHPPSRRAPSNPDWFDEAWQEARTLMEAAEGRTLMLCTSMRNAQEFAELAREELEWPVLLQGELPKPKLLAEFASDEHSIAIGTMGLWQGVDVAGPSLSLVIVDKLPFPRPDDPLWQARAEAVRRRFVAEGVSESDAGYRAFLEVQVPRAASLLAQGSGRLIRTATDRGVVAVLDPRLAEKAYRRPILEQLPPMRRTRTRADVVEHLEAGLTSS